MIHGFWNEVLLRERYINVNKKYIINKFTLKTNSFYPNVREWTCSNQPSRETIRMSAHARPTCSNIERVNGRACGELLTPWHTRWLFARLERSLYTPPQKSDESLNVYEYIAFSFCIRQSITRERPLSSAFLVFFSKRKLPNSPESKDSQIHFSHCPLFLRSHCRYFTLLQLLWNGWTRFVILCMRLQVEMEH